MLISIIIKSKKNEIVRKTGDVLFISGCSYEELPQCYRYRILHQIEQLKAGDLESNICFFNDLDLLLVNDYRFIIFYRCPWTPTVEKAIEHAKLLNKRVFFDIDDLVIDTKYTNLLPYIQTMTTSERDQYENGVNLIGKTLKLCQGAITTTEILQRELKNYVSEVFINHNVANEEMFQLSLKAIDRKSKRKKKDEIIIGYFSGSITHNSDFNLILPALKKILKEFNKVKLMIVGELKLSDELKEFSSQIVTHSFVNWKKLPELISNVDINIAPVEDNIFNEAKSEIKWVEASLVKVPTIASNIGSFKKKIINGKTGFLCTNNEDWYNALKKLLIDEDLKIAIGQNAFEFCKKNYNSLYTGYKISNYINSITTKHIGFFLPSLQISGGVIVVLMHSCFLKEIGWDVDLIIPYSDIKTYKFQGHVFNVIGLNNAIIDSQYDILVATLYTTFIDILNYYKTKRRLYLVQSYETDFYNFGNNLRIRAEETYTSPYNVEYITISKWCEKWLKEKYNKTPKYAPNGIDLSLFKEHKRDLKKSKIRILIEGDNSSYNKNVDESFKIVELLDKTKYEIWYMSYGAKPKSWYHVDKFHNKIPYDKVGEIYAQCDILIKSSFLESFSYPPLEMMATGGYSIVVPNEGNIEYLKDGENCLFYKLGKPESAVKCIERLISDENLQQYLYENGLMTSKKRDWKNCKEQIINLYK